MVTLLKKENLISEICDDTDKFDYLVEHNLNVFTYETLNEDLD